MKKIIAILYLLLGSVGCGNLSQSSYTDDELQKKEQQIVVAEKLRDAIEKMPCDTPWGEKIQPGDKILAFSRQETCDASCETLGIERVCKNGTLTGSNDFSYRSCMPSVCASCSLPWGGLLLHGESLDAFKQSEVSCSESCLASGKSGRRTCVNGELEGSGELVFGSCSARACTCALPWDPDTMVPTGSTITAYRQQTLSCGQSCEANRRERVCENGVWSGGVPIGEAEFNYSSCSEAVCRGCDLPWRDSEGGAIRIANDSYAEGFVSQSVTCGNNCDAPANQGRVTCSDGVLSNPKGIQHATCTTGSCACALPWNAMDSRPEGTRLPMFRQQSVACGGNCEAPENRLERICVQGQWDGNSLFNKQSCTPTICRSCSLPLPGSPPLPHNETREYFASLEVPCGEVCNTAANRGQFSCNDGTLQRSGPLGVARATCGVGSCGCQAPWNPAEFIANGTSVTTFDRPAVACSQSCSGFSQSRTCSNRVLSGDSSFNQRTCETQCVTCPITLADGRVIELAEGGQRSLSTRASVLGCEDNCSNYTATVQCNSVRGPDLRYRGQLAFVGTVPPGVTVGALRYETCQRPPEARCTSGGNPPRACALPGGYKHNFSLGPRSNLSRLYNSRYERPPHTRYSDCNDCRRYLHNFEMMGETVLYGFRLRGGETPTPFYDEWNYHISPDTVLTFYDTPVVDQRLDSEDSCDQRALAKRCDPDGYWVPAGAATQNRGGVGPYFEPTNSKSHIYTSCETIGAADNPWSSYVRILEDCLSSSGVGACIFDKNPFAANAGVIPLPAQLPALQKKSIDWSDPKSSGLLISESFRVLELKTTHTDYCNPWAVPPQPGRLPSSLTLAEIQRLKVYEPLPAPNENRRAIVKRFYAELEKENLRVGTNLPAGDVSNRLSSASSSSGFVPVNSNSIVNPRDYPMLRTQLYYSLENFTRSLQEKFGRSLVHFAYRSLYAIQGDPLFSNNAAFVQGDAPFLVFGPRLSFDFNPAGGLRERIGEPFSVDQSVIAHELGHANLFYAAGAPSLMGADTTVCGHRSQSRCCETEAGCFSAIHEGQADFFAAILLSQSPTVGDGIANDPRGLLSCGIPRDPRLNSELRIPQAFSACGPGQNGQVHALGAVYNSIWYEIWQSQSTDNKKNLERIFLKHLEFLSAASNFNDAMAAISQAEIALSGPGAAYWAPLLQAEYQSRR